VIGECCPEGRHPGHGHAVVPVARVGEVSFWCPEMLRSARDRAHLEQVGGRSGCAGLLVERAGRRLASWT
jgi:hypothetical protein